MSFGVGTPKQSRFFVVVVFTRSACLAVAVVDRPGWIRANVDGFRVVLEPLVEQFQRTRARRISRIEARVGDDRGGIAGHRHPGRADPGLHVLPGARPV